ncbi:MAG: hypothetical protein HZB68_04000 [Candidatus Aenigmarchaeota archaeon]|nr:hypothetical protein [Candidatus Aenigmarchaeota archaeon]
MDIKKVLKKLEQPGSFEPAGCALPFKKDGKEFWCAYFEFDQPHYGAINVFSYNDSLDDVKKAAEEKWLSSYDSLIEEANCLAGYSKEGMKANAALSGLNGGLMGAGAAIGGALISGAFFGIGAGAFGYIAYRNWRNKKNARKAADKLTEMKSKEKKFNLIKRDPKTMDGLSYRGMKKMLTSLRGEMDPSSFYEYRDIVKKHEESNGWQYSSGELSCQKNVLKPAPAGKKMAKRAYHIDGLVGIIKGISKKIPKFRERLDFDSYGDGEEAFYGGIYGGIDQIGVVEHLGDSNEKITSGGQAWEIKKWVNESFPRKAEIEKLYHGIEEAKKGTLLGIPLNARKDATVFRLEEELFHMEDEYKRGEFLKKKFDEGFFTGGITAAAFGIPLLTANASANGYRALKKYGGKIKDGIGSKTKKFKDGAKKTGRSIKDGFTYPYRKIRDYLKDD